MGGDKVDYGASVAVNASDISKAVNALRSFAMIDSMMSGYMSPLIFKHFESMLQDKNDRPDWIQKLEKEWGIR